MFVLTDGMHIICASIMLICVKAWPDFTGLSSPTCPFLPFRGDVFVFFSRKRDMVKILGWDTDGFILYQKRLEEGTFEVPRFNPDRVLWALMKTFLLIMQGVSARSAKCRKRFRLKWIHRCNNLYINILHYKYFANLFVFRFFFLSLTHAKGPLIELWGSTRSLKEQLEAAARREEHGQLLICELTMQVRQLTESVHSLEEALTLEKW